MKKTIVSITFFALSSLIIWSFSSDHSLVTDDNSSQGRSIASSKEARTSYKKRIRAINHLAICFESRSCGFSKNDSRSYDLELGNAIKRELDSLYEEILDNEVQASWVSSLARRYMKISNGHVKESALMLMSTQGPSSENLSSILNDAISFHSAPLAELALVELSKYQTSTWREEIDKSFITNLSRGSLFVRQTLAKNIESFLNSENRELYKEFVESLPGSSKVKRYIMASLNN